MRTPARTVLLIAAALTVAVGLTMCGDDPPPLARSGAHGESPDPSASADDSESSRPERAPRRHTARTAESPPPVPGSDFSSLLGGAPFERPLAPAADAPRPPGTGRVRVRMLDGDGIPFKGGHVCFYPEAAFGEPAPWDGITSSDGAYTALPVYTALWPHFDPVLKSGKPIRGFERVRGITDSDGYITLDVPAGRSLVTFVRYAMSGIPLVTNPRVNVDEGGEIELTIQAARKRTVKGRCLGGDGGPLEGIVLQALAPLAERPLSRLVESSASGDFEIVVFGDDPTVRLRAVVPYVSRPLGIYDSEAEVPAIPAETTVVGVVPDTGSVDVWMLDAPLVFIELTVPAGDGPLGHLQIEGLVFDPRAAAWGRLGGPHYRRSVRILEDSGALVPSTPAARSAFIALPRAVATRPLMLWSWGWTITAVDPRGLDRVRVPIPRGRRVELRGRGWRETDRLRVVAFCGPPGREIPCIWLDGRVGQTDRWARDDSPVAEIEFQIVRDGVVVGRSARVPAGTEPAAEVVIDVDP